MKILVITNNYPSPGNPVNGIFVHRVYKELEGHINVNVVLLVPGFGLPKVISTYSIDDIPVTAVRYFRPRGRIFNSVEGLFALSVVRLMLKLFRDYDLVHGHWQIETGPLGVFLSRFRRVPFLISVRGGNIFSKSRYTFYNLLSRVVFTTANLIHTHGKNIEGFLRTEFKIKREKLVFIPNIIYFNQPGKQVYTKTVTDHKKITILFVGIDSKRKGLKDAVVAFNRLKDDANVCFKIITDESAEYYRKQIKDLISDNEKIIVYKPVQPNYIYTYFQSADIFVFPSYNEGVPNALIEAMAMGCYIICYDIPGIKDIVRHRINGRLVKVGDINGLERELKWYLRNQGSPEIAKYKEYNQNFIEKHFETNQIKKNYIEMYSRLCESEKQCLFN